MEKGIVQVVNGERTFFFSGGGTGGHLFPGIAVAEEILRRDPSAGIRFVGSHRRLERTIIQDCDFGHVALPAVSTAQWKRHPLRFLAGNWRALRAAARWLDRERPAAVIGLGGYASVPMVLAASRHGVPVVLLEQNCVPGRATRWLAGKADAVCLSYEPARDLLPAKTRSLLTGNPVRAKIAELSRSASTPSSSGTLRLLILGGSQGAVALNTAIWDAIEQLTPGEQERLSIVHQTGFEDADRVRARASSIGLEAVIAPFFSDVPHLYRTTDLVIARAGATTLAELACAGLPSLLVPYPNSVGDHQRVNALHFEQSGASVMVEQSETACTRLAELLRELLDSPGELDDWSAAARSLAVPDAASRVADVILDLIERDAQVATKRVLSS